MVEKSEELKRFNVQMFFFLEDNHTKCCHGFLCKYKRD